MTVAAELVKNFVDTIVNLVEIDLTPFDEGIIYLAPTKNENQENIVFDGNTYLGCPLSFVQEGMEASLHIADINDDFANIIRTNDGCIGAVVTTFSTLRKYLADGTNPQNYRFGSERWEIYNVDALDKVHVSWRVGHPVKFSERLSRGIVTHEDFPGAGRVRQ